MLVHALKVARAHSHPRKTKKKSHLAGTTGFKLFTDNLYYNVTDVTFTSMKMLFLITWYVVVWLCQGALSVGT